MRVFILDAFLVPVKTETEGTGVLFLYSCMSRLFLICISVCVHSKCILISLKKTFIFLSTEYHAYGLRNKYVVCALSGIKYLKKEKNYNF